jgi:hypothetical protein
LFHCLFWSELWDGQICAYLSPAFPFHFSSQTYDQMQKVLKFMLLLVAM